MTANLGSTATSFNPDSSGPSTSGRDVDVSPGSLPALAFGGIVALNGPDAVAFAQAQLMNDLRVLSPGLWQWNGWLTPKGRVIALLAALHIDVDTLWLYLPDAPATAIAQQLQRFVFRSKLKLQALTDVVACADLHGDRTPPIATPARFTGDRAAGIVLDMGADGEPRRLALLPAGHAAIGAPDAAVELAWRQTDLRHGLPRLSPAQADAWTPQMLSLDRLNAYSLKKGCYPGQEIVARTHYLGQAKRTLVRVHGEGLQEGAQVLADGQPQGMIVCSAGSEALAVLPSSFGTLQEGRSIGLSSDGGVPITSVQLQHGLARYPDPVGGDRAD